ncbi:MAG: 2-succinyl-5-enolpyruvyl-6-hydroxy-3-cyclohexene-1-carboxylic-acid synthase [Bacteroidetes bacterium]|nr:2-succinyl-5-enolpyruvyl-6-hydroxy-3-cyclohexene-1-carboxylic-acid synthase [Bacteroidota bacterium]
MMHHQHIAELGPLLKSFGIRQVIICPGSRNALLIQLFTSEESFDCYSIVDERSAGYVALGMARQLQEPVVVVTTSGTAVLNLAPAIAEAYEQKVPLVVITADRPPEKIKQFNNQRLDQRAPFYAFSKGFYQFPLPVKHPEELTQLTERVGMLVSEAFLAPAGPVHMNIPMEESLYELLPPALQGKEYQPRLYEGDPVSWSQPFGTDTKIMVLAGMGSPGRPLMESLTWLTESCQAVVIAENIANLPGGDFISQPDLLLAGVEKERQKALVPDVVISFGGQVVSKRLKLLLQSRPNLEHYEIDGDVASSLEKLTQSISTTGATTCSNHFLEIWKKGEERGGEVREKKLESLEFGNLSVIRDLLSAVPEGSVIHLGNSSTIRYSQNLPHREDLSYYSNRGTSGIDGCVSAAVGAAMVSEGMHLLLVGDLSFVYDSNAMWNRNFPENLKIVVLNDKGGGIFRLLNGPSKMEFFEEYSVTRHPVSPEMLAQSFGRAAKRVGNRGELEGAISELFSPENRLSVLDVDTSGSENSRIFREFLDIKN